MKKQITVFTPTYNRAHTLTRLYESLATQTCMDFEWLIIDDGSIDDTKSVVQNFIKINRFPIRYIYKENEGLHTGYNTAYANIDTELCVCIDSDDFIPDNAVELILDKWRNDGSDKYAGLVGLDFYADKDIPIAGYFPKDLKECYYLDLYQKNIHRGDAKYVMRTDIMKKVAPQKGFRGEKYFNPTYMFLQVGDTYPLLVLNENICFVDNNLDGRMSLDIFHQYKQSPKSFAKLRELEMGLKRSTMKNRFRSAIHYVAESLIAKNRNFLATTSHKKLVLLSILPGVILYFIISQRND